MPATPGQFQFTVAATDGATAASETLRLHVYPFLTQPGVATLGLTARPSFLEPSTLTYEESDTAPLGSMVTVSHDPSGPVARFRLPTGLGATSCLAPPGTRLRCLVKVVVELPRSQHRVTLGTSVAEVTAGRAYPGGVLHLTPAGALALRGARRWSYEVALASVSTVGRRA